MTCDEVNPLLSAYMDEEVDRVQRAAIDAHLAACSTCVADLVELSRVRDAVRGGMPYYKAPAELRNQVRLALRGARSFDSAPRRTGGWRVWGYIAAALAFCALVTAPFLVNARNQRQLVAEELLSAHQRALMGRSIDIVSTDQHTVKPWFNGKLPFSPPVTDLRSEGYPLEGGRVDYAGGHPVAALVYSRRLHRIDVFVWPLDGQTAPPAHFERNGYQGYSWVKEDFLFNAVSDLNDAELTGFANLLKK